MKKIFFIIIAAIVFVVVAFIPVKKKDFYNLKDASVAGSFKNFIYRHSNTDYSNNSTLKVTSKGLFITGNDQHPPAAEMSDALLNAEGKKWLILKMSSSQGPFGGFYFKNSSGEEQYFVFPVISDQKIRTYNVFLGDENIPNKNLVSKFKGMINQFAILPTFERNSSGQIESVEFSETSSGKGFFVPEYCGAFNSLYRVGQPGLVAVRFRNMGGTSLTGISAKLIADEGLRQQSAFRDIPVSIEPFGKATLYVDILPLSQGEKNFKVILTSKEGETLEIPGKLMIEPSLAEVRKVSGIDSGKGYIPVPKPISVPHYDIGMYYFSGWSHLNHWPSLVGFAERKPELGFYDESSPEGADWTIKWATEHGVEFMNVLLYWRDHLPWNNKFLDEGLMKAKFLPFIKFYVTWSNDLGNETTDDDFLNFYKFVIDQYFKSPSYKKSEDGRHMVGILSVNKMTAALTMPKLESLKQKVNDYAIGKGYKGIFWVGGDGGSSKYKINGFEGFTYYNYPIGGANGYPCSNAKHLIASQPIPWKGLVADGCLTIIPTSTGFDCRPWYGKMVWCQRYNFTPALFEKNLRDAKSFLDSINQNTLVIESWNEWGEGSSLGPHGLFGFSLLDVIPKVFAPDEKERPHLIPKDVDVFAPEIQGIWEVPGIVKPDYGVNLPEIDPKDRK